MFLVVQSRQNKFHTFVGFFHFNWVPNRDRWKLISFIQKNCLETSFRWVNEKPPFHTIIPQTKKFNQTSKIVTVDQWKCFINREYISKFSLTFSIPMECYSRCQWTFLLKTSTQYLRRLLGKVQVLYQVIKFSLGQRHWLVVLLWPVCITLSCISLVTRFGIRTRFHGDIWLRNRKIWAMGDWIYGRRNIRVLNMVLVLGIDDF